MVASIIRAALAALLAASAAAQVSYGSGVNGSLCGDTGLGFVSRPSLPSRDRKPSAN
jgi:hypothetical protein